MKFDLNCDLGEGERPARSEALMRVVTSVNVACGGHAGTVRSMELCTILAARHRVHLGAHPGVKTSGAGGRGAIEISPDELELVVVQQVSGLLCVARRNRVRLHHVKLHGSLYHAADSDPRLARRYLQTVGREWPWLKIYARAGGAVERAARRGDCTVWPEGFLDRGYQPDGTLVPRNGPAALLTRVDEVVARLRTWRARMEVQSVSGAMLHLPVKTLCIHSDTPNSVRLARAVASHLSLR